MTLLALFGGGHGATQQLGSGGGSVGRGLPSRFVQLLKFISASSVLRISTERLLATACATTALTIFLYVANAVTSASRRVASVPPGDSGVSLFSVSVNCSRTAVVLTNVEAVVLTEVEAALQIAERVVSS